MNATTVFRLRSDLAWLQRGAVAVEFALVAGLFMLTLLIGIFELGRAFFFMNATAEATRLGARIAVVCDASEETRDFVRERMRGYVKVLPAEKIDVAYSPSLADCAAGHCRSVTVSVLPGASFETFIPFAPVAWTLPAFATTLPSESLDSSSNERCH
jgi:Flp pilus assembly protein TadG